jgi:hypothetical protein
MNTSLARMTGAVAMAVAVGSTALLGPVSPASAAPAAASTAAKSAATSAPTGERNTKVSRSMRGVRSSAYVG